MSPVTKEAEDLSFTLKIETTLPSAEPGFFSRLEEDDSRVINITPVRIGQCKRREVTPKPFPEPDSEEWYYLDDEEIEKGKRNPVYDYEFVDFTESELKSMPGYTADTMTFENEWMDCETNEIYAKTTKTFTKDGGFSCWDVINNIVEFEMLDRPNSMWCGGLDTHHIYYEGLCFHKESGTVGTCWGS